MEYRYHDTEEWKKLTRAHKKELFEYCKNAEGKSRGGGKGGRGGRTVSNVGTRLLPHHECGG